MTDLEMWRPVAGFEGFYEVSTDGNVRSLDRSAFSARRGGVRFGRTLSPFMDPVNGYLYVNLSMNGKAKKRSVHSMVLEAFVGPCPLGMEACHGDGRRTNALLSNLRWDTKKKNWDDKRRHGTATIGEKNVRSRLTEDMCRQILKRPESSKVLAREFGVASSTVRAVRIGQNWKHLAGVSQEVECAF